MVHRKNMRRTKPTQPIYRPGNGPLRKSNTFEDSESDTNLLLNVKRYNNDIENNSESIRHKSEGNSPRETHSTRSYGDSSGDTALNDTTKRPKKPEKMIYVPRPLAQARDNSVQQSNSNSYSTSKVNGYYENSSKTKDGINSSNSSKSYSERRIQQHDTKSKWGDSLGTSQMHGEGLAQNSKSKYDF